MTGTAMTESEEFYDIYKLNVVSIPTNKKMLRKDFNDQIYRTEKEKYNAISNKIIECNNKGQPVLVGTTSIEKSEKISKYLNTKKIKHNVLNAKHHDQEARIISKIKSKNFFSKIAAKAICSFKNIFKNLWKIQIWNP